MAGVGKIAMDGDSLAALAGDRSHHALGGFFAGAVVDGNGGAFGGQAGRDLGADTLGCAGYQRHFALKSLGHPALHVSANAHIVQ